MSQQSTLSQRFIATCVDFLILPPLGLLVMLVTGLIEDADAYVMPWFYLRIWGLLILSYLLLQGFPLFTRGQTVGKLLVGIKIVSLDGTPASAFNLFTRTFVLISIALIPFPYNFLGLLLIIDPLFIFGKDRRCLHDHIGQTKVVQL
ncbi:MAG: RDD family protein [Pseudomonadales bacterium]|nr:RDD family protein [Pseudomonadales bacterium]MDG1441614.1 RDD family protein [Pseudomonadales bacterium]